MAGPVPEARADRHPLLLVPPPLLFVVAFALGKLLERLLPVPHVPSGLAWLRMAIGAGLVLLGVVLGPGCAVLFLRRRTTLIPHGHASVLVTSGPYRRTRNPMYVGLVLIYLGAAVLANAFWAAILVVLPVGVLNALVIPYEERTLTRIFGPAYVDYCQRVRRWL